jgi:hypothetical protein
MTSVVMLTAMVKMVEIASVGHPSTNEVRVNRRIVLKISQYLRGEPVES